MSNRLCSHQYDPLQTILDVSFIHVEKIDFEPRITLPQCQ